MPQVPSVRVSRPLAEDAYGSGELQVDDGSAHGADAPPPSAHTSMSGIQFGEAVCPPPTRCCAESGTQWGQAAAERE